MFLPIINPVLFFALTESQQKQIEKIYFQYSETMYKTAKIILKNESLADEVVQQSFVKIMDILEKNNEELCSKTSGYFVIIVKHLCIDLLRKENAHAHISWDELPYETEQDQEPSTSFQDPSKLVVSDEGYGRLIQFVMELDDKYSTPLKLKLIHGMTEKEIAQLLEMNEKTVGSRIYRGRQILIKRIEEEVNHDL